MDITYNMFVDNGLYVASYYLNKNTEDITIEDLKANTELFSNKFIEYESCGFYKKNIDMGFHNSNYTQGFKKDSTKQKSVKAQYDLLLNNIGDDEYCSVCGKKHIKYNVDEKYLSGLSRSLMPRIHSNTFINYINNMQIVNICPICFYLSLISLFNFTKSGALITLINSDDKELMEDFTYEKQSEVIRNIALKSEESKEKISNNKYMSNFIKDILNKDKLYDGYIQSIGFYNGGQSEDYIENILTSTDMKFLKNLQNKSLLSEFEENNLFYKILNNKLQTNYLSCVIDYSKGIKLKLSQELFNEIEGVYSIMSKDKLQLIKRICEKVYKTNTKDEVLQLKNINGLNQFETLLIKWSNDYKTQTNENLFELSDFDNLCNFKEFNSVKNRMLVQFSLLN